MHRSAIIKMMPVASPEILLSRLASARERTDRLFQLVHPDSLYDRPIPERHRSVFYIGHLEAFDWNLLQSGGACDPVLDRLFAFGIDPVNGSLPTDQPKDWPAMPQVEQYRDRVRRALDTKLQRDEVPEQLLHVAIEHRLMHAETLAYMFHQLPLDRKTRESQAPVLEYGRPENRWIEIPAGPVTLGNLPADFGWDNEFNAHVVQVPSFATERYKVTNARFLEFLEVGGYRDRSLWSAAGWAWKEQHGIEHPVFWKCEGGAWRYRTMFDEIPLPLYWPVYVSHAEAAAFATWTGKRLPTEAEWQRACYGTHAGAEHQYPWGAEAPAPQYGYFDFERWDPFPVNAFPAGQSAFGVEGMLANGWEWTSSLFEPFSGFEPFPFYKGYSADFFDGKHYVMKGGSTRTAECMLRRSFRNWFQPHYQYAYASFRCAL